MHRCGYEFFPFKLYDPKCCEKTRWTKPENCMFLCGKTRHEWMNEAAEKEVEENGKETDRAEGEEPGETDVPGDDRA